jgi:putative flavoprotein involved in K+ transport
MALDDTDTLIVGGGQAGLAMSEHLSRHGVPHLILERHRIAERWRSERWDSLVANGPAWHDRFPTMEFAGLDPDAFASKEDVADYFVAYAEQISAPIHSGVEVTEVRRSVGRPGFDLSEKSPPPHFSGATGRSAKPVHLTRNKISPP